MQTRAARKASEDRGVEPKRREGKSVSEQRVQHTQSPHTGVLETGFFPGLVLFGSHSVF